MANGNKNLVKRSDHELLDPMTLEERFREYDKLYGGVTSSLAGSVGAYITFGGRQFSVRTGGTTQPILTPDGHPAGHIDVAFLGVTRTCHKVLYENGYDPSRGGEAPLAVWWDDQPPPAHVPRKYVETKKEIPGQKPTNWYQLKRRIVVALCDHDRENRLIVPDLDNIYAMDVSGMSLFGKINPPQYTLTGLFDVLRYRNIRPAALPVRVMFDQSMSIPVLRFALFPKAAGSAEPWVFPDRIVEAVMAKAISPAVTRYLDPVADSLRVQSAQPERPRVEVRPAPLEDDEDDEVEPTAKFDRSRYSSSTAWIVSGQRDEQEFLRKQVAALQKALAEAEAKAKPEPEGPGDPGDMAIDESDVPSAIQAPEIQKTVKAARDAAKRGRQKLAAAPPAEPEPEPVDEGPVEPMDEGPAEPETAGGSGDPVADRIKQELAAFVGD